MSVLGNGYAHDVGIDSELRHEKPCSARVNGDVGGWCVLSIDHEGPHVGVSRGALTSSEDAPEPSPYEHPWKDKWRMPQFSSRKPDPEDE